MTDITKKYLDSKLGQIGKKLDQTATKKDLESFATKKDLESFATKKDLKESEANLSNHIDKQIGELASMVSHGFEEVKEQLDVRKQVKALRQRMHRIEQALNL